MQQTLTENQVWDYYIRRNMWANDVDFETLKAELRKKGVNIVEKRARYGTYIVFVENERENDCDIIMPDASKRTVAKSELKEY